MRTVSEIIEGILAARGIAAADVGRFLHPSLDDLGRPEDLPGVAEATEVILGALSEQRRIVVFGDYDCDGVSATAIVVRALQALGASVEAFLPERLSEGYGMSDAAVTRMLGEYPDVGLVITVDNGINSVSQIAALRAHGIAVVVTDHHLPGETLPTADALVNPKVSAPPVHTELCGAGVAFMLAHNLISAAKARGIYEGPNIAGPLLVLAGLATVTDIMPLLGENRALVALALAHFRSWAPIGLRELHSRAARTGVEYLTSKDFGYTLGPRINAAGRLKSGMEALELLMTDDRDIACELARIVDMYNTDRKAVEQKMTEDALGKVVAGAPAQVIDLPDGNPGVAGIVAARVLERLDGVGPVCVLASGHGSARSPEGLNIRDAFVACDEFLTNYGGHAAAGGFLVKPGCVDAFREVLCAYCAQRADRILAAKKPDDAFDFELDTAEATLPLAEALLQLEPFGECNPEPVFVFRNIRIADVKPLGAEGRHLSSTLAPMGAPLNMPHRLRAVWWNHGEDVERIRAACAVPHEVRCALIVSDYGERHAELRIVSID